MPQVYYFDNDWLQAGEAGLVSVIMPCFNVARYVDEAIQSALKQDYDGPIEVMVADDGSTDETPAILTKLAAGESRIRMLPASSRSGPFSVRNRLMREARGQWIAFLDGDDAWSPEKVRKQVAALERQPEVGLSHGILLNIDSNGSAMPTNADYFAAYDGQVFDRMLRRNGVANSAVIVPRHVFAATGGFDETFRYRGDWEMWTRIAQRYPLSLVNEPLGLYRRHDANVSSDPARLRPYAFAILDKFRNGFGIQDPEQLAIIDAARIDMHRGFGLNFLVNRDYPAAKADLSATLRLAPLDWQSWLALAKCWIYPLLGR
jgi:glycosyltransferase involved in cell wall biosynthesis